MAGSRYDLIAQENWAWLGPAYRGIDADLAAVEAAIPAGGVGPSGSSADRVNVQKSDGTWALGKATVDAVHAAGFVVQWFTDGTLSPMVLPTAADGLDDGDLLDGKRPEVIAVAIPVGSVPTATDAQGAAGDKVILSKVAGVTWTVGGVDYPSSSMVGATQEVAVSTGTSVVVTAKPSSAAYAITSTPTSWTLAFTDDTATILTSDSFATAAALTDNGPYSTKAQLGGSAMAVNSSGPTATIAAGVLSGGAWTGLFADRANTTNLGIEVKIAALPVGAAAKLTLINQQSFDLAEAVIYPGGYARLQHNSGGTSVDSGATGQPAVAVGDVLRFEYRNGDLRLLRNGTQVLQMTRPATFVGNRWRFRLESGGTSVKFDDFKLMTL